MCFGGALDGLRITASQGDDEWYSLRVFEYQTVAFL